MHPLIPPETVAALNSLRDDLTAALANEQLRYSGETERLRHDLVTSLHQYANDWEQRHNDNLEKLAHHVTDLRTDLETTIRHNSDEFQTILQNLAEQIPAAIKDLRDELHLTLDQKRRTLEQDVSTAVESANRYNESARANDTRMLLARLDDLSDFVDQEHVTNGQRAQKSRYLVASTTLAITMILEALDQITAPTAAENRKGQN